jgi:peptide chain release factor 1
MIDQVYLDKMTTRQAELESQMASGDVAGSPNKLRELMTEYSHVKKLIAIASDFLGLLETIEESKMLLADPDSDEELCEMAKMELVEAEEKLDAAERAVMIALIPPDPNDSKNVIIEIRAGTGGDEAALFVGDLYRMYSRYAETAGWRLSVMDASDSESGGYKEIVFSLEGEDVYKKMKYESGTHRVQRVPATETKGRVHTSAATVAVLAEAEEVDIEVKTCDLKVDTYRASGAGGQHVNTTDSAVRITHIPTGVIVQCQDERSQHKNRDKCMRMLRAKLLDHVQQEQADKQADARKLQVGSGDRSEKIRTYNYPQNRLTDHRINLTLYKLDRVMEGVLDECLDALFEYDLEQKMKESTLAE